MRKNIQTFLVGGVLLFGSLSATDKVYFVNSSDLLQKSKEGKVVLSESEKLKQDLMNLEFRKSNEINEFKKEVEEGLRAGKINDEQLQDKYEKLTQMQRRAKRDLEEAKEDFEMQSQKGIVKFRDKVFNVARDYFKQEGCNYVLDMGTPGVIYVSDASDKTNQLLKEVDKRFDKEKVASTIKKS